jgi:hypothetical protein
MVQGRQPSDDLDVCSSIMKKSIITPLQSVSLWKDEDELKKKLEGASPCFICYLVVVVASMNVQNGKAMLWALLRKPFLKLVSLIAHELSTRCDLY